MKTAKRGFVPSDEKEFRGEVLEKLKKAAAEFQYLLEQGYPVKAASVFVGNHYMFSERQRLAIVRSVSTEEALRNRQEKQVSLTELSGKTVSIDGFNTIISLEVALSGSPVLKGIDGTVRDLAGLRGTYRIIDKTITAVNLLFQELDRLETAKAVIYLDAPVSNSGRLKVLLLEEAEKYQVDVEVTVICQVDQELEKCSYVVSSDAIILNRCISWVNLVPHILKKQVPDTWYVEL